MLMYIVLSVRNVRVTLLKKQGRVGTAINVAFLYIGQGWYLYISYI